MFHTTDSYREGYYVRFTTFLLDVVTIIVFGLFLIIAYKRAFLGTSIAGYAANRDLCNLKKWKKPWKFQRIIIIAGFSP